LGGLTDDELMLMFSDGNVEAFDLLFDRHHSSVYHFACSMLNDSIRAQDILQETFLAVVRSAKKYEPRGRFRTWLLRIARNRCLNALESDRFRHNTLVEGSLAYADPPSREPTADEQVIANETQRVLQQTLARLPHRQREVIVLYAFENLTCREIGEVLDMPVNTVKTLVHRARAALAQALDERREKKHDM
jgi:RNA polymerase sigma-70 factor (ECF subfamily)